MRAGPGTGFPVVGLLYQNDRAALLGRSQAGDWLHVRLPDSLGWIFAPLVETSLPIADLPVVDPPPRPRPLAGLLVAAAADPSTDRRHRPMISAADNG